jgi:biopolymer transport protein ExbB/TolQ
LNRRSAASRTAVLAQQYVTKANMMDATGIAYLGMGLATTAAAIAGFFALFGKGPRGTVLMVAACLLAWGVMLPIVLRDPDYGTIPRELDLLAVVLQLSGIVGAVFGIFDLLQHRPPNHPSSDWIVAWILRQPFIWGGAASVAFYELLYLRVIDSPLLVRYLAGHPVEYAEGSLFFVGFAALAIRYLTVTLQHRSLRRLSLDLLPVGGQLIADCDHLLGQLAELPRPLQQGYLANRLRDALEYVRRKNSADSLDQHLHHLEELDLAQMCAGYSIVRIAIWAIPILGFLGTVIGITMAIASLSPQALEQSLPEVTAGLGVAFDTTAEALGLSLILVFGKSWVERAENRLLSAVDARVSAELVGRFPNSGIDSDPNVAAIRRMSEQVLEGVESLASRQAEVWRATIDDTHRQWAEVSLAAGKIVKDSLSTALTGTLDHHAKTLSENLGRQTKMLGDEISRHAECLSTSASQHADKLDQSAQQTAARLRDGLGTLAELLVEALHQHGEVLTNSEQGLAEENRRHLAEVEAAVGEAMVVAADRQEQLIRQSESLLREMQAALVKTSGAAVRQQEQMVKQGDMLLQVVGATGQVKTLEDSLNQNLDALRRAHSFENVVLSLSAAIQSLNSRLGGLPAGTSTVDTAGGHHASQAA